MQHLDNDATLNIELMQCLCDFTRGHWIDDITERLTIVDPEELPAIQIVLLPDGRHVIYSQQFPIDTGFVIIFEEESLSFSIYTKIPGVFESSEFRDINDLPEFQIFITLDGLLNVYSQHFPVNTMFRLSFDKEIRSFSIYADMPLQQVESDSDSEDTVFFAHDDEMDVSDDCVEGFTPLRGKNGASILPSKVSKNEDTDDCVEGVTPGFTRNLYLM